MAALVALGGTAGASTAVPAPTLKLLAGTGVPGYLGDGSPAVGAQLYQPMGVAVDAAGNVLVADLSNRIRKITPDASSRRSPDPASPVSPATAARRRTRSSTIRPVSSSTPLARS